MYKLIASILTLSILLPACNQQKSSGESNEIGDTPEISLEEVWSTDAVFKTPESTIFDSERNVIYVANINGKAVVKDGNGFISRVSPEGEVLDLEWISGLNGPTGMGIYDNRLFVNDIDEVVEIDIENSTIINKHKAEGAVFLNDLTIDENGIIFSSDSRGGKIYRFEGGRAEVFVDQDVESVNGLLFHSGRLYALVNGSKTFNSFDPESKSMTQLTAYEAHGDGLELANDSDFIISNWDGQVLYWNGREMKILLDTKAQQINAADIDYIQDKKLLLVPTFADNRLRAYRLVEK